MRLGGDFEELEPPDVAVGFFCLLGNEDEVAAFGLGLLLFEVELEDHHVQDQEPVQGHDFPTPVNALGYAFSFMRPPELGSEPFQSLLLCRSFGFAFGWRPWPSLVTDRFIYTCFQVHICEADIMLCWPSSS